MDAGTLSALLALFVGTSLVVWLISSAIERRHQMRRRFRAMSSGSGEQARSGENASAPAGVLGAWTEGIERYARPLSKLTLPQDGEAISLLRRRMLNAGWRARSDSAIFMASRLFMTVLLPCMAWMVSGVLPGATISGSVQALALSVAAALGYLLPGGILRIVISRRQRAIFEAFPDALDLMLVCVEAGLGLDLAMQRVAAELRSRCVPLSDELEMVCADVRAGAGREHALQRMSERIGLDEVTGFAAMLTQADRFGTSIGDALRVQADALRTTRRFRAQEQAAKVPVKLLFPLVFFIFPSLFTVLLGPAAIRVWRVLVPALQSAA